MNEKFFSLQKEKQNRIINAGLKVFANNGYKHATTEAITHEAGISKGLLFHYFGSKKGFYLFLYDHAINTMMERLTELHDYDKTDFFDIVTDAQLRKIDIMYEYPDLSLFVVKCYLEESPEAGTEVSKTFQELVAESMQRMLERIDATKFKDTITVEQALNILTWISEGFMKGLELDTFADIEEVNCLFLEYMELLRTHFYREECL